MSVSKLSLKLSQIVALVLLLIPFHAMLTIWLGSNIGHLDLLRIWKEIILTAMVPAIGWIIWRSPPLKQWFKTSWITRLFGLYILVHALLGIWTLSNHQVNASALIYSFIINLRFVGFFLICTVLAFKSDYLSERWRNLLLWPAIIVIVFGILQVIALPQDFLRHLGYGSGTIPAYQTVDANLDYQRIQSTLRGANPLGAYLVLVIPALLFIAKRTKSFLIGTLLGATFILYYSYSRSAWLGLVIALISLAVLSGKLKTKRVVATALLIVLIFVATSLQLLRSNQTAQDALLHTSTLSSSSVTSNEARLIAIKQGFKDIIHKPLGRGPGTAGPASFRNSGYEPRIAESYFLQIGQEVGWLGMALIIGIMFLVAAELWRRRDEPLAQILLASFVGLTFINLLSHAWTDDTIAYLWWGLAGLACAPHQPAVRHSRPRR